MKDAFNYHFKAFKHLIEILGEYSDYNESGNLMYSTRLADILT